MKFSSACLQIVLLALLLSGCGTAIPEPTAPSTLPVLTEATEPSLPPETEPVPAPEETLLASLSLREKVGQLFLVRPDALNLSIPFGDLDNSQGEGVTEWMPYMEETLNRYPVGGFVHFGKNIVSPEQITAFNASLLSSGKVPPFLAVDEEGGLVARLANTPAFSLPRFESAAAVGSQGPDAAREMGYNIGVYLSEFGFQMDFAPVADVNTNPQNRVIGTRAFSSDPQQAAACARAMADGLRQNGILPVFKHFPGHGDTMEDSHLGLAISHKDRDALLSCEWVPFRQAENREAVMVGHIALPTVTGNNTPATFSKDIITGILRDELNYQGLIITDSLSMGAVIQEYSSSQAALLALEAGCDLLLMPASLPEAFEAVVSAVEEGSFPEAELDARVLKILQAKQDYHILN